MGSVPGFSSLPACNVAVAFLATRVPSKVSRRASWTSQFLDTIFVIVELSFRTKRMVLTTAKGPSTKTRAASCGKYVKVNMAAVTLIVRVK